MSIDVRTADVELNFMVVLYSPHGGTSQPLAIETGE